MNLLKRNLLALAMLSALSLSGVAMAEEKAVLESTPATQAAPATMDELIQTSPKCNKRDGSGPGMMQGMGMQGMGMRMGMMSSPEDVEKCHKGQKGINKMDGEGKRGHCDRKGHGAGCDCPVADRVDELEKRMDMMQMMMKMMMQR